MQQLRVDLRGNDFPGLRLRGQGIGWTLWDQDLTGHSGATPGYYAIVMTQATEHGPIVILQNVGCSLFCDQDWFVGAHTPIRELLLREARRLRAQHEQGTHEHRLRGVPPSGIK